MFYCRLEKREALQLCGEEFLKVFGSHDQDTILAACQKHDSFDICRFELKKFRVVDPSFATAFTSKSYVFFSPVSILLYVAIQCEKVGRRQKYVDWFMILEQFFDTSHDLGADYVESHQRLKVILLQTTLELHMLELPCIEEQLISPVKKTKDISDQANLCCCMI